MKYGFTTGSAATAATKAALIYLLTNEEKEITVETPAGKKYVPSVYGYESKKKNQNSVCKDDFATCFVIKESGDDPDITSGMEIHSKVTITEKEGIEIVGGKGIGRVTRPGLDQEVGEYAINSTPRKMIKDSVEELLSQYELHFGVLVEISAPQGEEIAKKTFNPHMGIEGGISIIGTSGIVKPMSTEALLDTIRLDINMQFSEGKEKCVIVPGNYGVTFLENNYRIREKDIVLCSNYVEDSMKFAYETGFKKILFCSHIGKMIKVSGGVFNTHSKYGDKRMEFMWDAISEVVNSRFSEFDLDNLKCEIMNCVSTTAALNVIEKTDIIKDVSEVIVRKTKHNLEHLLNDEVEIDVILYENSYGELARSFKKAFMVHFVGAGCGAKDLITIRGKEHIEKADVIIYAGSLVNRELLEYNTKGARIYDSAFMTLEEVLSVIYESEKEDLYIVRLHTGDPSIYGAIKEQMDELDRHGIDYDVTPGVSAAFGAAASLKAEYTLPEVSQTLILTRMSGKTKVPEKESIKSLASHKATMAIYLSASLADQLEKELLEGGYEKDTPAAVCVKVTWDDEKIFRCSVGTIKDTVIKNEIKKTAIFIIGDSIRPDNYEKSRLYAADFSTEYRKASK